MKTIRYTGFWKVASFVSVLVLIFTVLALASSQLSGDEILTDLKNETSLTGSGTAVINLITENSNGQQKSSAIKIYRQIKGEIEKQLIEYLAPADVKGTKFLSRKEEGMEDAEMWLYLPALGRERRIAGHRTKDNFMDTDFTFEEIGGNKDYKQEYEADRLVDEEIDGYLCYSLNLTAKTKTSQYRQVKMWVWQQEMLPLKVEFYDQYGQLSKMLELKELEQSDDGTYQPNRVIMSNLLEQSRSIIEIVESSSQPVDELYFSIKYLRR